MKRIVGLIMIMGLVGIGVSSYAQSDLDTFPIGTTELVYQITTEEMDSPQSLGLTIISRGDDDYTLSMSIEGSGTADQLADFGFLFTGAQMSYAGGENVSYSPLQALMEQRSHLQAGNDYILPGGGSFKDITLVEIAGVQCLQGSLVDPSNADTRTTMAFSISDPVYMFPRVRVEELRDGQWFTKLQMKLTIYTFTPPEG
ncbi:MAG: hypothetical protein U9Q94_08835 [Candidatus Bipolaricaulota bacterium]|nr:hypothetical protein [Candidatus Bipolaricaulota bacterium]